MNTGAIHNTLALLLLENNYINKNNHLIFYSGASFERPPWQEVNHSLKAIWQCKSQHKCIDYYPWWEANPLERPYSIMMTLQTASLLGTQALGWGFGIAARLVKGRLVYGTVYAGLSLVREKSGKFKVREKSGNFRISQGNLEFC